MSDWYEATGIPATKSFGSSAEIRGQYQLIAQSFNKMPTLTGNPNKGLFVNASGTAIEAKSAADTRALLGLEIGSDIQPYSPALENSDASFTTVLEGEYNNVVTKFDVEHSSSTGKHKKVTLPSQGVVPTAGTDELVVYSRQFEGEAEYFIRDSAGKELRLTSHLNGNMVLNVDLSETDLLVGSIRTRTFSRGRVVDLQPVAGVLTIDWRLATVFRLSGFTQDTDVQFINMPDTAVEEEQTIYLDITGASTYVLTVTASYDIYFPRGITPTLTDGGRDLLVATTDDGVSVMCVPITNMEIPAP